MNFVTYTVADVGTAYLLESDLDLIGCRNAPGHLAETDDAGGSLFYTPAFAWTPETETELQAQRRAWDGYELQCRDFGLSERFIQIMKALYDQRIRYVRFDSDGGDVDGLRIVQVRR